MALLPINALIVVKRKEFTLELRERSLLSWRLRTTKVYQIAVGAKGYATPADAYLINTRSKCPEWLVPDSNWAWENYELHGGPQPGTVVPGCTEENPLKKRWLGFSDPEDGYGIHGTSSLLSIGTRASHGCIRMRPDDIIELYPKVPKYTPVVIF